MTELTPDQTAAHDQLVAHVRAVWPDKTDEWRTKYLERLLYYVEHNGYMAGAPELPED